MGDWIDRFLAFAEKRFFRRRVAFGFVVVYGCLEFLGDRLLTGLSSVLC